MLRTVQLLPQKRFRHWASTRTVSTPSRQSATGPPDSYPDRTHTGKRRRARTNRSPRHEAPPVPLGARKIQVRRPFRPLQYPHWASPRSRRLSRPPNDAGTGSGVGVRYFPTEVKLHRWELGFKQSSLRLITRVPWRTVPIPGHGHQFPDMLLSPSPFGIQVSHRTQRYLLQSLPATPGIRASASWRTGVFDDGPAGVAVPAAGLFQGAAADLVQGLCSPHHDMERIEANRRLRCLLPALR